MTNRTTRQEVIGYGADPDVIFRAAAYVFGYSGGACGLDDALALVGIGTETGTLDDAAALAAAYRAAAA